MALAVKNGVLYDNSSQWRSYFVLNSEETDVYEIILVDNALDVVIRDAVENNPVIVDDSNGKSYLISVTAGNIGLDEIGKSSGEGSFTGCSDGSDLCAKIDNIKLDIAMVRNIVDIIKVRTRKNNWKIIS